MSLNAHHEYTRRCRPFQWCSKTTAHSSSPWWLNSCQDKKKWGADGKKKIKLQRDLSVDMFLGLSSCISIVILWIEFCFASVLSLSKTTINLNSPQDFSQNYKQPGFPTLFLQQQQHRYTTLFLQGRDALQLLLKPAILLPWHLS